MASLGLWMLLAAVLLALGTGAPLYAALLGSATLFGLAGAALGPLDVRLLGALPSRIVGLLEQDLLQALPLYAWIGALLNRTALAGVLLRMGARLLGRGARGSEWAGLGLGALLAPMNGAVGANVTLLTHALLPALRARGATPARATALVCVGSTLGVAIPPSLVLILLGDAMMRAHTEAVNQTGASVRIVNTQDVMQAALLPGALVLLGALAVVALTRWRAVPATESSAPPVSPLTPAQWLTGSTAALAIVALLALVAGGRLYAVEGAATGALLLLLYALATRQLSRATLWAVIDDAARVTGLVFALLVAATCCSLVVRAFGTDALVGRAITALAATPGLALAAVIGTVGVCALVLDAFELIFLVIPVVMPPLLAVVPDAAWVGCLTLLVLQLGFLLPPFGYAVLAARAAQPQPPPLRALGRALAPFVAAQVLVLATVVAWPELTQWLRSNPATLPDRSTQLNEDEVERALREAAGMPVDAASEAAAPAR